MATLHLAAVCSTLMATMLAPQAVPPERTSPPAPVTRAPSASPIAARASPDVVVFPPNQSPSAASPTHFTGSVTVTSPFTGSAGSTLGGATVTFRRGAHTNWHTHPRGQWLIVTHGHGWVQAEGGPVRAIGPGDVVWTAPGVKHWHGATRTDAMTHVGITEADHGTTVTWLEAVTDAEYHGPR